MAIKSFKRYEKKFILSENQYSNLILRLSDYMELDKFCKGGNNYSIYNIYYDINRCNDFFCEFYKEKANSDIKKLFSR